MFSDKKKFLDSFDEFLDSFETGEYGKCYFKLINGQELQGWISEISERTFVYFDSGPLSREEPYILNIEDIDVGTFAYWDDDIKQWTEYFVQDKFENRLRVRN